MRVYARILAAGFRTQSRYLPAAFAGLLANATFGLLKSGILLTLVGDGAAIGGYTAGTMAAYVWLSQGLLGSVNIWSLPLSAQRIKSGDIAVDFLRPADVQLASIADDVGRGLFALIPRGLPSVGVGVLLVGMAMPSEALPYVLGAVSLVLGITLSHTLTYLLGTAGFWLVEVRGLQGLYMGVAGLLTGLITPVWLFPDWLRMIAVATPFPAVMMYPIDVLSGRTTGLDALALIGAQAGWLALALAAGAVTTRLGRRKLEVQGG
ncbi:ABC transporter permease [Myceligenerans indicum]|uniref:ABC transporter permease n=1 Tax=Myceligenerans indicum TaxID=2593663 RepID=A0ABS1LNM8_9MICO|nr:ABC-2 family transporter protein [Myceligenerans indicum]MBL0887653.1 ABC transporter permease [Myceligenerans indicum]